MHTELAAVPDFTLQCRSRLPGDCGRYVGKLRWLRIRVIT